MSETKEAKEILGDVVAEIAAGLEGDTTISIPKDARRLHVTIKEKGTHPLAIFERVKRADEAGNTKEATGAFVFSIPPNAAEGASFVLPSKVGAITVEGNANNPAVTFSQLDDATYEALNSLRLSIGEPMKAPDEHAGKMDSLHKAGFVSKSFRHDPKGQAGNDPRYQLTEKGRKELH